MAELIEFPRRSKKLETKRRPDIIWLIAIGIAGFSLAIIAGFGSMWLYNRSLTTEVQEGQRVSFAMCTTFRRNNCVIDGDTIWLAGRKIRIADIDAPEKFSPICANELRLARRATARLLELVNEGPIELQPIGSRDQDQYGRDLRVVILNGRSVGDLLVSEGLARTWTGRREPWC